MNKLNIIEIIENLDSYIKSKGNKGSKIHAESLDEQNIIIEDKDIDGLLIGNCKLLSLNFKNVFWGGAYITNTEFFNSIFINTNFRKAEVYRSNFTNCIFVDCRFIGASFHNCKMTNCVFDKNDFTNIFFNNCDVKNTIFSNSQNGNESILENNKKENILFE